MHTKIRSMLLLALTLFAVSASAGQVEIRHALFQKAGSDWLVSVTLFHHDTGWDHYADGWQVVDQQGHVLGHRTLYHPHVNEQPFTRSHTIHIPEGIRVVFVEAHDKVHGWSPQRLRVDLSLAEGPGYEIRR